ncbi:unnamed protein product [Caenorhabditis nigoni]
MAYVSSDVNLNPSIPLTTNAFYRVFENTIAVSPGLVDDPHFHHSFPKYAKLAGIGITIGHEIGHALDSNNIDYDQNGDFRKWLADEDKKEYLKRVQCLVKQYNQYDDPKFGRNMVALPYCAPRSRLTLKQQLEQWHPTESFRINGVFSNMNAFAETFNCPVGSPMNPKNKCELF